ncbi:MAG: methyltransferase domain-containing protein [Dehalococcoidia bacterium]
MTTNEVATRGFAAASSAYERGRPDYPPAVIAALASDLRIRPGTRLLDLATGTGKLARRFTGVAEVIGVDPAAEMCLEFARLQPGVPVIRGNAETLPLAAGSMDAALVGTAFHWFDGPVALRELHRVLRPGARLGLVWLQRDETVDWVAELVRLVDTYRPPDARRFAETPWQSAFEDDAGAALFTPLESREFPFAFEVDRATAVARTASTSFVAALPPERRQEVLDRVAGFLDAHPSTRDRATIALPHRAEVFWSVRRDA